MILKPSRRDLVKYGGGLGAAFLMGQRNARGQILSPILAGNPPAAASGPVAIDAYDVIGYTGSGGNSISHTASGANRIAVVFVWTAAAISAAPTYDGVSMTLATSTAMTLSYPGFAYIYYLIAPPTGAKTVAYGATSDSAGGVLTLTGAHQSGQPDALASFISGTSDGSSEVALPITTVTNGSMVLGMFGGGSAISTSPSSNGTFLSPSDALGTQYNWYSTSNVASAGAFTLKGKMAVNPVVYGAIGISVRP